MKPQDVISIVVVIGAIILLARGVYLWGDASLLGIVVVYYVLDLSPWIKLGRNQGDVIH
ncbi:unnamed protein product [marine sediment metagenome]|uniref:Uncharacterized protein n=1 Tax=marine sediment metagenome TaxID=412755 RepID=X1Q7J0_9ZZZZ